MTSAATRTTIRAAIVAAAALLLVGCGSTAGQPTVGTTPPTSATSASASTSTETSEDTTSSESTTSDDTTSEDTTSEDTTSEDTTSEDPTSDETESSVQPAELDQQTNDWFVLLCDGVNNASVYASPDTTGQDLTEVQATVVEAYTNIAASAEATISEFETVGPPNVEGGDGLQTTAVGQFQVLADVYGRGADTIAAQTPTSGEEIEAAISAVEDEARAAQQAAAAEATEPPPDVQAAAREIPECAGVFS